MTTRRTIMRVMGTCMLRQTRSGRSSLRASGVGAAIVVGMGGGPLAAMNANGITAFFDDQSPTPRSAVEAYLAGNLAAFGSSNTCQGH